MNKVPVMDEEPFCRCAMCRSALVKAATIAWAVASWSATYAQSARRCMRFAM